MTIRRPTLIGIAVAIGLFGQSALATAQAQSASAGNSSDSNALEEIVVSGIRYADEQSLETKRAADSVQEVITAEDIGKMPDKNVADSLARITGVTTSSASANEGGFDENDRISMRGTNPSLTQTLVNGHAIAAGDWFVLNQVQQVGRSVSYTLLPSELVSKIVVHKSSEASLVEGGVAGSVDILTRRPLDFKNTWTGGLTAGAVYADKPSKTDPQVSGLLNWKNDTGSFGVELLGYEQIAPGSAVATAHPDLASVYYPALIGEAFFQQKRERKGGMVDVQFKATDDLTFDAQFFTSKLDAANVNYNYLQWLTHYVNKGAGQSPDAGYVIKNGTLTQANFSPVAGTLYGVYDQISRPDESATANYGSLDIGWRANDKLSFTAQLGISRGDGKTPTQDVSETNPGNGTGAGYQLNGLGAAPNFNLGTQNSTTPVPNGVPVSFGWIFGAQNVDVKDKEDWAQIDSKLDIDNGAWTDLQFGVRYNKHERSSANAIAQGPNFTNAGYDPTSPTHYPGTFSNYPSNFTTFGGNMPPNVWLWSTSQLAEYNNAAQANRDLVTRAYYQYWFSVEEKNSAAFVQADFKGSNWSGNIGVRFVRTKENAVTYTQVNAATPGAITTSAFGPFTGIPVDHSYNDILPSANLKWDIAQDLVGRFAISKTMTRADYSALAGFTDLSPPAVAGGTGTGSGGNPDLKPIRSTNLDAGLEWYFSRNSLLAGSVFYMNLQNYVGYGSSVKNYLTFSSQAPQGEDVPYLLTVPVNARGRVQGAELTYQQALFDNFGVAANYTYADGKQTSLVTTGDDRLVGTSKNTYNLSGYYENARFSARVTYTHRSAFFSGLDRNSAFSQDAIGSLAASLNLNVTDYLTVTLDGQNLSNSTLKYYALNTDQPRAFYKNGAQYYLSLRARF